MVELDTSLAVQVEALPALAPPPETMADLEVAPGPEAVCNIIRCSSMAYTVVDLEPEPEAEPKTQPDVKAQPASASPSEPVAELG